SIRMSRTVTTDPARVKEVIPTDKVEVGFKDIDAAILVGQRGHLQDAGRALDKYAKKTVRVSPLAPSPRSSLQDPGQDPEQGL
uniref:Uncharacterized protein n=1 Tax=Salarias fasciatus TaxID=181472 RepID=A0A672IJ91_SALFA